MSLPSLPSSELAPLSAGPRSEPYQIAIVDDEPLFLYLVGDALKDSGNDVTTFQTPGELLAGYRPNTWDVIITDYSMPGLNGIELLSELRLRGYQRPVLLLTGTGDEALAASAFKGGACDYIIKQPGPGTLRDIVRAVQTAAKSSRLEQENLLLRHEVERFANAARSVGDALMTLDPSGVVTFASGAAAQRLAVDNDNLLGRSLFDLLTFDGSTTPAEILAIASAGCFRGMAQQRQQMAVLVTLSPLRGAVLTPQGEQGPCDLVALVVDASLWQQRVERRETELATTLIRRRLEGVGSLAARMAHEINNPTTWLTLNLETIADEITDRLEEPDPEKNLDYIDTGTLTRWLGLVQGCLNGVDRISSHTGRLLTITREDASAARPIKPAMAALAALTLLGRDATRTPVIDLLNDPVLVAAEEVTLAHAIAALLENAFDAVLPPDGTDPSEVRGVRLILRPRSTFVEFVVEDCGRGIQTETLERLFEPFFTTKGDRGGTGLGLPMARTIARRFGGDVTIESLVGQSPWRTASVLTVPLVSVSSSAVPVADAPFERSST